MCSNTGLNAGCLVPPPPLHQDFSSCCSLCQIQRLALHRQQHQYVKIKLGPCAKHFLMQSPLQGLASKSSGNAASTTLLRQRVTKSEWRKNSQTHSLGCSQVACSLQNWFSTERSWWGNFICGEPQCCVGQEHSVGDSPFSWSIHCAHTGRISPLQSQKTLSQVSQLCLPANQLISTEGESLAIFPGETIRAHSQELLSRPVGTNFLMTEAQTCTRCAIPESPSTPSLTGQAP